MQWIDNDVVLEGERVLLRPMRSEDIDELVQVGNDPRIWEFLSVSFEEQHIREQFFEEALRNRDKGTQYPFTIFDRAGNIIGTTRFGEMEPEHRKLEIGWTWYRPSVWGNGNNEECKYLLLSYAFEKLGAVRVQLKTNEKNYRSRRAILRLGCKFEGIYRNHVIRQGVVRNSAMFSMLPEEWPVEKENLKTIVDAKYQGAYAFKDDACNTHYNGYTITTQKHLMQPERIHQWLSTQSYWLEGAPLQIIKTALDHSFCIGVLHDGVQIGYARFVTDYARFAYLADVYIEEEHRGKGLSKKMMEVLHSLDWVKGICKLMLHTKDAHSLYTRFGYAAPPYPDRYLEKFQKQPWQ
ncbi:GNAT family N-acetyltransferase [Polluticoccus soli]|uniref:GNAT family N-acetyltransferase n=1 Tax=Polluticoccus soli TaxID=3034150 RepID=UPI0023E170B1|nr:GNAT family N-acetyltransferase [Flavipsychrobacter sp. JY13-12]